MARQILVLQAPGAPTAAQLEAQLNAALAALVNPVVMAVQIVLTDTTPAYNRTYRVMIEYDDAGGAVMAEPFQVRVIEATDLDHARAGILAFRALNPGWFYATVDYRYTDIIPNISNRNVAIQFYCEDEPAGYANWQVQAVTPAGPPAPTTREIAVLLSPAAAYTLNGSSAVAAVAPWPGAALVLGCYDGNDFWALSADGATIQIWTGDGTSWAAGPTYASAYQPNGVACDGVNIICDNLTGTPGTLLGGPVAGPLAEIPVDPSLLLVAGVAANPALGSPFVCLGLDASNNTWVAQSSDGQSWTLGPAPVLEFPLLPSAGVFRAKNRWFLQASDGTMYTTLDPLTGWNPATVAGGTPTSPILSISHNGSVFVATNVAGDVFTSVSGGSWTLSSANPGGAIPSVAGCLTGKVVLLALGGFPNDVYTSVTDGATWAAPFASGSYLTVVGAR